MLRLYVLVGVPGAGKSTWVNKQDWAKDCAYISTDMHVDNYAKSVGKTYSEVFEEFMPKAVDLMARDVIAARKAGKDIIWDQTSTTKASRRRKFKMLPEYYAIAVIFPIPDRDELDRRLQSRSGKHIPKKVINQMINSFSMPTEDEGFSEIHVMETKVDN